MRDAMRKRQAGLRAMVVEDPPFSRDAAWEGYFHAARDFIVARELLLAAGLNPQEETALGKLMDRAYEAYLKQQRVINLIREDFSGPEIITLLNEVMESQELVTERTRQLEHIVTEAESFSYALAHDLRQPLRGLDGYSHPAGGARQGTEPGSQVHARQDTHRNPAHRGTCWMVCLPSPA